MMRNYWLFLSVAVMIFLISLYLIYSVRQKIDYRCEGCNIILISIDALRADHLGSYGYFRNTSPHIDEIASEGILFKNAFTTASWTLPSHMSLFTSLYPPELVKSDFHNGLDASETTLAEILKKNGYRTAAFVGGLYLSSVFNLNQGFETWYESQENTLGTFQKISPEVFSWLEENKNHKVFLFIHAYDVHEPYSGAEMFYKNYSGVLENLSLVRSNLESFRNTETGELSLSKEDIEYIIANYDADIVQVDKFIGEFVEKLKELGLYNRSVIIIISDHGEQLMEHGSIGHVGLYDEVMRVPLIIKHPKLGFKNKTIENQVTLMDILPTILDMTNIKTHSEIRGMSLFPYILSSEKSDRFVYAFVYNPVSRKFGSVIRTGKWKFFDREENNKQEELYNLEEDPEEKNNLAKERLNIVKDLKENLMNLKNNMKFKYNFSEDNKIDENLMRKLREFGYVN
jgi:arylsulfatase A-like enzyme